jgi:predicted GH43/DUF377 family glycosyl hydrolase
MASIALPKTKDFRSYTRLGIITSEGSDNKDLIIFPEKINQKYVFLRRPRTWVGPKFDVDKPSIWIGEGDILSNFDKHSLSNLCLLYPEKINQKYVFLRRPRTWVGPKFDVDKPSIWIGEGDILSNFDKHSLLMKPEQECEECEARLLMFT